MHNFFKLCRYFIEDTTTYIPISNDVLIFYYIKTQSVVKYKYPPSKPLENTLFTVSYLSNDFIVGINNTI